MKHDTLQSLSLKILVWGGGVILALLPFHAFLTVWAASLVGHYTALRLWPEVVLLVMAVAGVKLLYGDAALRRKVFSDRLIQVILAYTVLSVACGAIALAAGGVNKTALADGLILNLRFLLFFGLLWLVGQKTAVLRQWWRRLLLGPAILVIAIGLAQRFLLPYDVLKHFGYNSNTIYPYETIDHKRAYLRVQSTLRGANPLGAYLVIIITAALQWLIARRNRWAPAALIISGDLVLFFSGSRSAMLGLLLSAALVLYVAVRPARVRRWLLLAAASLILIAGATGVILHNNDTFQNNIFHTDEHSTSADSSDQGHVAALKGGLKDVAEHPLGHGVGAAGPASTHNAPQPGRIAENYFVQVAQETGWLGLGLFAAIYYLVAKRLWLRRQDSLALVLLCSLAGLTIVNLLSHAWTDDTLAFVWWGFAGITLSGKPNEVTKKAR